MIEPEEVQALMSASGLTDPADLLPALVPQAQHLARPPISSFAVGAVGLGSSGRIYLGSNLEFPGLPLHHSVHAEQFLIANAASAGEPQIRSIAVSAAPCGHCRQFFQELRNASDIKILVTSDEAPAYRPLIDFLPRPFGPVDLLRSDVPLLLEKHRSNSNNNIILTIESATVNGKIYACNGDSSQIEELLVKAAAEAAGEAHAPYSGCPAGFAVADGEGRVYKGPYMESAAFNPGLGPVQAAMVGYLVGGGGEWEGIVGGALVEEEGAKVSHEATARIFFERVAPDARVWVRRFKM